MTVRHVARWRLTAQVSLVEFARSPVARTTVRPGRCRTNGIDHHNCRCRDFDRTRFAVPGLRAPASARDDEQRRTGCKHRVRLTRKVVFSVQIPEITSDIGMISADEERSQGRTTRPQ